jgi:MHS family proline/betaine transporter-like MFS transporter
MTSPASAATPQIPTVQRRSMISAVFGNFMEYIDFGSYGFLAAIIGSVFFSGGTPAVQLLSSLAVFGVSFLFRPFGGAIFGYIADRYGRKTSLSWSVILMAVSTGLIGCIPNTHAIGALAPILLVLFRIIQGLSIGGEYSAGSAYVIESAPTNRRGVYGSFMSWTAAAGTIVGSGLVLILTGVLSSDAMNSWGWRIPFLIAFPIGLVGLYMRLKLEDTPVYRDLQDTVTKPINPYRALGLKGVKAILLCIAFGGGTGLGYYYFATYLNTYLSSNVGMDRTAAITINLVSLVVYGACTPFVGMLADRFGRKWLFVIGFFAFAVYGIPVFFLLNAGFGIAFAGVLLFGIIESILNVLTVVVMPEIFPTNSRVTGGAIGYNIGIALISGTGPFVAALLVTISGNPIAPGFYLAAMMLIVGIIVVLFLPETKNRSLYMEQEEVELAEAPTATA